VGSNTRLSICFDRSTRRRLRRHGFYFLRARYYDTATGRSIGRDPVEFEQRYAYAGNNPALLVDPSGTCYFGLPCVSREARQKVAGSLNGVALALDTSVVAVVGVTTVAGFLGGPEGCGGGFALGWAT